MKTVCATDIGLVRKENQDMVRADMLGDNVFAVVCDGMGGERSGKKASQTAINAVFESFLSEYKSDAMHDQIKNWLINSISAANSKVYNTAKNDPKSFGMGTTCVAAFVTPDTIYIANAGDSRAYLVADGKITQLTNDHTYARMLFERGDIQEHEISSHPQRNMLTKAVGVEKSITPDYFEAIHNRNFKVMLCSDGLSGFCSSEEMLEILLNDDIQKASDDLVKLAISKGGRDNITLAIIAG